MNSIEIKEKPDYVSWEDIKLTLINAHKENLKKGLVVKSKSTTLSPIQLQEQVSDGVLYVAFIQNKLVGTGAVRIKSCDRWFYHGKVAHFLLDSVLIDYQGMGINSLLNKKRYEYVNNNGISVITASTAASNKRMLKILPKQGFHRASFFKAEDIDHFSITWVKWLERKPLTVKRIICYYLTVLRTMLSYIKYKIFCCLRSK